MANLGNVKIDSFSPTGDPNVMTINVTRESRVDKHGNIHSSHDSGDIFIKIQDNAYKFMTNPDRQSPPYPICVYQTFPIKQNVCTELTAMTSPWSYTWQNDQMIKLHIPDFGAGNRYEYRLFIYGPGGKFSIDPIIACCYKESILQIVADRFHTTIENVVLVAVIAAYLAGIGTMKLVGLFGAKSGPKR
ncbi:MAG TPA: hypothetical protein PK808_03620 [Polymorphobacter sp.]|jgi:hypothetical protein|nr:hypothetical protein [Polymorphobacter sp.]